MFPSNNNTSQHALKFADWDSFYFYTKPLVLEILDLNHFNGQEEQLEKVERAFLKLSLSFNPDHSKQEHYVYQLLQWLESEDVIKDRLLLNMDRLIDFFYCPN